MMIHDASNGMSNGFDSVQNVKSMINTMYFEATWHVSGSLTPNMDLVSLRL